jgi:hypothetical protein
VEATILDAVRKGLNVFVSAPAGSGLTTSLRFVAGALRRSGWKAIQVNARVEKGPLSLLRLVAFELSRSTPDLQARTSLTAALGASPVSGMSESLQALQMIDAIGQSIKDDSEPHVVLVDRATAQQVEALFGRLRDEMWGLPIRWVVGANERSLGFFLFSPTDAFFEVRTDMGQLSPDEAAALIRRRAPNLDEETIRRIASEVATPREAVSLLRMADQGNESVADLATERAVRAERADQIGGPAAMLLAELEHGPASAADPEFLARLGWTRQRAYQVLRQLEDAGLVEATSVPGEKGRPRKVYRVVRS